MKSAQKTNTMNENHAGLSPDYWITEGFSPREATELSTELQNSKRKRSKESSQKRVLNQQVSNDSLLSIQNSGTIFTFNKTQAPVQITSEPICVDWFKQIVCAVGSLVCTAALTALGAESGGWSIASWFWSTLIVVSSSILLSLDFSLSSPRAWIQKILGLWILAVGYLTMHASIQSGREQAISQTVFASTEILQLEKQIATLEERLSPTRNAIKTLDPIQYQTTIARMQAKSKPLEDELALTRKELIEAKDRQERKAAISSINIWSHVEILRRLILEPLNILCLHNFIGCLPNLIQSLRRRGIRLVQVAAI